MDIASASIAMNMSKAQVSASFSVAKKAMDTSEVQAAGLLDMMQAAPSFGHKLDVRV